MGRIESQNRRVLTHLMAGYTITQDQAKELYGVNRLSARIWDIRHKMGYEVKKDTRVVRNRYGDACNIAEYRMENVVRLVKV